jgi:SAM-dependent methyltransferase
VTGFTPAIRAQIREGAMRSADVLVPILLAEFPDTETVIDVGCGEGWWTVAFATHSDRIRERGIAVGVDLDPPLVEGVVGAAFHSADLRRPLHEQDTFAKFDMAVSLEVAEHLPPERAEGFVADLCTLADVVVFSAAIPGQGGTGHLNEQWPGYWADLFAAHGYWTSGYMRWRIWDDDRVENWYRQNLLVAISDDLFARWRGEVEIEAMRRFQADCPPRHVVHPVLWDHYRGLS